MTDTPYELERLVTIGTFSTTWEAQIAQARLGAEGLHSLIADEHVIRMVALSNAVGGIQLKVRERDVEAAGAALRRLAPLPEIYLIPPAGDTATAAGAPVDPAFAPAQPVAPARPTVAPPPPPASRQDLTGTGAGCPACGGGELRPERSSRLVLGLLPVSRRGYRCGDCGSFWRAEEIGGVARLGVPRQGPEPAAGAPGEDEDAALVTVARFHTPWEAHLARTFLESEGLRCCVLEDRLPAVHLLSAEPVAFNRLEVHQADAAHATEILARAWSQPALVAVPDPDAGDSEPDAASGDHEL